MNDFPTDVDVTLPGNADFNMATANSVMKESAAQNGPLDIQGSYQQVESNGTESISLEEGHEEAKADEHHDVNILEH
jgi:hypothetical protein